MVVRHELHRRHLNAGWRNIGYRPDENFRCPNVNRAPYGVPGQHFAGFFLYILILVCTVYVIQENPYKE